MMQTTDMKMDALRQAIYQISDKLGVDINALNSGRRHTAMVFGVNWSAKGTQPVKDALEYAECLKQAAMIASTLTELDLNPIPVDYDDPVDWRELSEDEYREEFRKAVDTITDMLCNNMSRTLANYIRA